VVLVDGINKGIKQSSLSLKLFPKMVLLNSSSVIVVKLLVKNKYLRLCDLTHLFHRKSETTIGKLSLINIFYYRYQFLDTKVETRKSTIKVKVFKLYEQLQFQALKFKMQLTLKPLHRFIVHIFILKVEHFNHYD